MVAIFVCSTCEHHKIATGKGLHTCAMDCGGPLVGGAFPMYKGPLAGNLPNWCMICGIRSDAAIRVQANGIDKGFVGVCEAHIKTLSEYAHGRLGVRVWTHGGQNVENVDEDGSDT